MAVPSVGLTTTRSYGPIATTSAMWQICTAPAGRIADAGPSRSPGAVLGWRALELDCLMVEPQTHTITSWGHLYICEIAATLPVPRRRYRRRPATAAA